MQSSSKRILVGLLAIPSLGLGLGCGSSEVERAELPAIPIPDAVPVSEAPVDERPDDIGGSSAGIDAGQARGPVTRDGWRHRRHGRPRGLTAGGGDPIVRAT